jgi:hypothetical protein
MDLLDCRYAGGQKEIIQLSTDLQTGWEDLGKNWGFDKTVKLPYLSESYFRCRLRVAALVPDKRESARIFSGDELSCVLGQNSVLVNGPKMEVNIPLSNTWRPTRDSGNPIVYEIGDPLFSLTVVDETIGYRVQLWVVLHGPRNMFVRDQYEWGDGFAWIGGRPESNRRKF